MREDQNGDLWLIVDDGLCSPLFHSDLDATWEEWKEAVRIGARPRLFRFNPHTGEAVFIDLNAEMDALSRARVNDVLSGPDGALWIEAQGEDPTQDKVLRYEPETGRLQDLGTPSQQYGDISRLYLDHQGRLWTSHVAWADVGQTPAPSWHALNPTLFFMPGLWPGDDIKSIVAQIYQTSDGLMWFTTGPGLITYDLEKNEWTRVTSMSSAIVQDENGYIWTAAYGQFYRYKPAR